MTKATAVRKAQHRATGAPKKIGDFPASASNQLGHDLEQAIPYLLARAGMRMGQAFSRELKMFNLTLAEWRILAALLSVPHQRLAELAEHTSAEPSTLSRTVDGLVTRELLVRERSGEDARALALRLTPQGEDLAQRIVPLAQVYERVALAGLSAAQVDQLKDTLRRIYVNMNNLDGNV